MDSKYANILIAMSGGVDSATCAKIITDCDIPCAGATMKLFDNKTIGRPIHSTCCSLDDIDDAKQICCDLHIPHYTINCKSDFKKYVIDEFVKSYLAGSTPNPCIACNRYLKFDILLNKARQMGFDAIATGHYARICKDSGKLVLLKGKDETKDQSYVLHTLTANQLKRVIFPLGEITKKDVRNIAKFDNLKVANKKESQDICFIENHDINEFINFYTKSNIFNSNYKKGIFVNKFGNKLGEYNIANSYTIGQRKGLNLSLGRPVYVTEIDKKNNIITIGEKQDLVKHTIFANDFNWISILPKENSKIKCKAKIRYNMKELDCIAYKLNDNKAKVIFKDGVLAPAKQQSIVLYDGEMVLGGGFISGYL